MTFKIGQLIVCIDDSPFDGEKYKSLVKNKIYIVIEDKGSSVKITDENNIDRSWFKERFKLVRDVKTLKVPLP